MPAAGRSPLSAPFAHRELNGEILLEELADLREADVRQRQLEECAAALKSLSGLRATEAMAKLRQLASGRFQSQPALAGLLLRWAAKLRTDADVTALAQHFRQLAIVGALIGVLRRGDRVVGGALR
ncbi:MAG: hypothetical protein IRZ16_08170 [Myxococcaceae bacterium]|nr:hypothetical protein [Myxococcaceae bacterium]